MIVSRKPMKLRVIFRKGKKFLKAGVVLQGGIFGLKSISTF